MSAIATLTVGMIKEMKLPQLRAEYVAPKRTDSERAHVLTELLDRIQSDVWGALPAHVSRKRQISLVLKTVRKDTKLLYCTLESMIAALSDAAALGLEIDDQLGQAYLIPYGKEVKLVIGYRGLLDLARRFDSINLYTACVYEGDDFRHQLGDDPKIVHVPKQSGGGYSDEDVTHVYLVAKDQEGRIICRSVWSRERIEAHKEKFSPSWKKSDSPWQKTWSTMARKTLIRDSINRGELPVSAEIRKLALQEEYIEAELAEPKAPSTRRPNTIGDLNSDPQNKAIDTVVVERTPEAERGPVIEPEREASPEASKTPKGKPAKQPPANKKPKTDKLESENVEEWLARLWDGALMGDYETADCVSSLSKAHSEGIVTQEQVDSFRKQMS